MPNSLVGCWSLRAWQRTSEDVSASYPLGEHPSGLLVYTADGLMAVQLTALQRPVIKVSDPLNGGSVNQRAAAYSTCLAYYGTYKVHDTNVVVHTIEGSLFPDWTGQQQPRPFTVEGDTLTLHTPTMHLPTGDVTNALIWTRREGQTTPNHC
jgi:hypothetical protein